MSSNTCEMMEAVSISEPHKELTNKLATSESYETDTNIDASFTESETSEKAKENTEEPENSPSAEKKKSLLRTSKKALSKMKRELKTSKKALIRELTPWRRRNLIIKMLPFELLDKNIFSKLPEQSHRFLSPVCRTFRDAYAASHNEKTETCLHNLGSVSQIALYLKESNQSNDRSACPPHRVGQKMAKWYVAAASGDRELLNWYGMSHWVSCQGAARAGHLEMLRYIREERRFRWNWKTCAAAAAGGHDHVLAYAMANGCKHKTSLTGGEDDPQVEGPGGESDLQVEGPKDSSEEGDKKKYKRLPAKRMRWGSLTAFAAPVDIELDLSLHKSLHGSMHGSMHESMHGEIAHLQAKMASLS